MTPWLRRQWHVLSLLRPVGRAPTRPFRPRAYASNPPVVHRLNSAIIIPSNVPGTQPDDIIAYINPVTTTLKDRLAVFFVTPAFATWLLDDFTFLRKALDKIFKTAASQSLWRHTRIEAVVAVVDKLPVPRPLEDAGNIAEESLKRAQNPPVLDTGHEGVAYAVLNKNDTVRDLDAYATEKGAITFLLSDRPAVDGSGISLKTLHLPLANTIFQTGTTTTIKHTVWVSQGGDGDLELTSSRDLEHFGLRLQKHGHTLPSATVLSVPLIPLTEPRVVEASMGNIVRRVFDSNGKSVTASEELEQRVPQYFTSRHEPSQHMTVWALVIPQSALPSISQNTERFLSAGSVGANANAEAPLLELWKSMWNSDPARWNELVPQALERGARLHRVLSGGGGWGKKAGLLSLDPSFNSKTEVSYPDLASPPGLSEKFDDFSSVLHNIIQPGDAVQFFIFPGDVQHGSTASETAPEQLQRLSNSALPWTWEIGTIPSTIDSIQNTARQFSKPPPKEIHVVRGSFGALSEGAMRFKHQFMPKDSYNSMVKGGCDIDVPFTRLAAVGLKALSEPERTTRSLDSLTHPQPRRIYDTLLRKVSSLPDTPIPSIFRPKTFWRPKLDILKPETTLETPSKRQTDNSDLPLNDIQDLTKYQHGPRVDWESTTVAIIAKATQQHTTQVSVSMQYRDVLFQLNRNILRINAQAKAIVDNIIKRETAATLELLHKHIDYISNTVLEVGDEASDILEFVHTRATLIETTNSSAVNTYVLHISLRWRLSQMIARYENQPKIRRPLVRKLVQLRTFNEALFVERGHNTPPDVKKKLDDLEEQNPTFTLLRLSNAGRQLGSRLFPPTSIQAQNRINAEGRRGKIGHSNGTASAKSRRAKENRLLIPRPPTKQLMAWEYVAQPVEKVDESDFLRRKILRKKKTPVIISKHIVEDWSLEKKEPVRGLVGGRRRSRLGEQRRKRVKHEDEKKWEDEQDLASMVRQWIGGF